MPDHEEKPLDPEVEKIRRRMMRLMIVSILIMLVGLIAVFAGVVYKFNTQASDGAEIDAGRPTKNLSTEHLYSGPSIAIDLPEGARVMDKKIDGKVLIIDVQLEDGGREFFVIDLVAGSVTTSVVVK